MADPSAALYHIGHYTCIAHGVPTSFRARLEHVLSKSGSPGELGEIVRTCDEANLVVVQKHDDRATEVLAWRGNTSSFEIYYLSRPASNELILSDNFRNLLVQLDLAERTVSQTALADHILFRVPVGEDTLLASIHRLGHGTRLHWTGSRITCAIFDRLEASPDSLDPLKRIDCALQSATHELRATPDTVNQLSGGIDSTLIHTYLGKSMPSISAAIDSPEFRFEVDRAIAASKVLYCRHRVIDVFESDYLEVIKRTISNLGFPPEAMQTPLYEAVYTSTYSRYVTGNFADTLFGLSTAKWASRAFKFQYLLRTLAGVSLSRYLPPPIRSRVRIHARRAWQIRLPVESWRGLAMQFMLYTDTGDLSVAVRLLGENTVKARLEQRAEYARARFQSADRSGNELHEHLEFGHMIDFYYNDSVTQWRQLAQWHGKSLIAPFRVRPVVECALSVPRRYRYIRSGRVKYLLKELLKRRLPRFDVDVCKGGGDLPMSRYFESGCLRTAFDQFPMPDFIQSDSATAFRSTFSGITWSLLTFAIWRDLVLHNTELTPCPHTRIVTIPFANDPHSATNISDSTSGNDERPLPEVSHETRDPQHDVPHDATLFCP